MIVICGPCKIGRCNQCLCVTQFCDCNHRGGIYNDTIEHPNRRPVMPQFIVWCSRNSFYECSTLEEAMATRKSTGGVIYYPLPMENVSKEVNKDEVNKDK